MVRVGLNIAMAHACRQWHNQASWPLTETRHRSFMALYNYAPLCYANWSCLSYFQSRLCKLFWCVVIQEWCEMSTKFTVDNCWNLVSPLFTTRIIFVFTFWMSKRPVHTMPIHNTIMKLYVSKMNENKEIIPTKYTRNPPDHRRRITIFPPPQTDVIRWSHDMLMVPKKKLYFVIVTMSRLNHDFQWTIRDKQSLLRARFLHLIMKHAWSGNRTADQRHAKRTC